MCTTLKILISTLLITLRQVELWNFLCDLLHPNQDWRILRTEHKRVSDFEKSVYGEQKKKL